MKVINSCKCTQAIVPQTEVRIPCFSSHVNGKHETFAINPLWQALENSRDKEDMPVLNRTDLLSSMKQVTILNYAKS